MILKSTQTRQQSAAKLIENREWLSTEMRSFIRSQFDNTVLSTEAESWIAIAKEHGFDDMVAEMESDLQTELETY